MIRMNSKITLTLHNFGKVPSLLFLPFAFPRKFFRLAWTGLTNPRLMGELVEHFPHRKWIQSKKFATFIDVGSFIGSSSFAIRVMRPDIDIFAFEPVQSNYEFLITNMKSDMHFKAYQVALGSTNGSGEIHQNAFPASSSILELDEQHKRQYPYAASTSREKVQIARLDDYLAEMKISPPVFLKIDVQGFELEVLKGAENCLDQVECVFLEVSFLPLYKGQCGFDGIHEFLSTRGFVFMGSYDHQYTKSGDLIQADLLYCRNPGS